MSANVRCPGCGWKGERYTLGETVYTGDGTAENPRRYDWKANWNNDLEARIRKPCPRCGGKVALFPGWPEETTP